MHGERRTFRWGVGYLLILALMAVALAASFWRGDSGAATDTAASPEATALQNDFVRVLSLVRPSVVEISTQLGLGSGVVYDSKGDIVTNAHVVAGATELRVRFADKRTVSATLVGTYEPDDLAVIRVSSPNLRVASFADSSRVRVGDIVLAIGNPLGLSSSVTNGIVSATDRTVGEGDGVVLPSTIQTSADINPGNSGGGLVDLDGRVIGIPTLTATDPELGGSAPGIGFAIPSNTVKRIADQLIATGKVTNSDRASLGITGATASTSTGQSVGVLVSAARAPASRAGISSGDVITGVNGRRTPTLSDLQFELALLQPGARTSVKVLHSDGTTQSYRLALGSL